MSHLINKEFSMKSMTPLTNANGDIVEKYLPRKCSATSRVIGPKDHAAIQLLIPNVDAKGRIVPGNGTTIVISGYVRDKGLSDWEIEKIARSQNLYPSFPPVGEKVNASN